ncbi:PQQ-dependent sugar dehydrogenase [Ruegeria sediminis]|uniref:PQQ-dependent sugar dehydrogenase n=1 Tax=Ruegeria sediminis TaxID=2583820 RepID=A0ABY2X131_9RHOB|nr:PQQ-dependent sugar dehydrogenase [Ruegeria sediminis]TMV08548.1 PQQ-dependent sugar dehydrogenase [Ruegeria sediminis]
MRLFQVILFCCFCGAAAAAESLDTSLGPVQIDKVADGLDTPWAIGLLPDGSFLVTERSGNLIHVKDGRKNRVAGVPKVYARGQGGLLDVTIPLDFASTREVFLTLAKRQRGGAGTAVAIGRLSENGTRLTDLRTIFETAPGGSGGRHFGSRVVEAPDGTLFVTVGERGDRPSAQDRSNHNGSIVRINRDGSVPADNPFAGQAGVRPEIWSFGHRNPQGAALDRNGQLWVSEHGAKGGDEVNRIRKGANYGWPVISYGVHYSGARIGEGTSKPGMEQPEFYWDPSIAPSGLMIYSGKLWPKWKGNFFVGSLKFDYISRLTGTQLQEAEQIKGPETKRVRDIVEAPDGSIWFISVGQGAVYRMRP